MKNSTSKAPMIENHSHSLSLYQYYRPPLDWQAQLAFYRLRAVTGMEWFNFCDENIDLKGETLNQGRDIIDSMLQGEYGRTLQIDNMCAVVQIAHEPNLHRFKLTLTLTGNSPLGGIQKLISENCVVLVILISFYIRI